MRGCPTSRLLIPSLIVFSLFFVLPPINAQMNWSGYSSTPKAGGYGEAVIGTGDHIYVVRCPYATSEVYFWRYDPDSDSWVSLSTPCVDGETIGIFRSGTALTWDGGDYIYALAGAGYGDPDRRLFLGYSIYDDEWSVLANTPSPQGAGDAVCWSSYNNMLYALLGSSAHGTVFACYDPSGDSWSVIGE